MERSSRQTDPYRQLGLSEGASLEQVSRAYRRLVHDSHPDTHQGDPAAVETFRAVVDARDWIVDRTRRSEQAPVRAAGPPLRAGPVHVQAHEGDPASFRFRTGLVIGPLLHERGR